MLKISVIIITYNRKKELIDSFSSILKQTINPYEIIIIDNNSTDGTDEIFGLELSNPLLKYFRQNTNLGVAGGRNYGLKQASGDILVFIDDDALLEPKNALEKIISGFEKEPQIGVLAFKIINFYTKTIQREEFPHIDKSLNSNKAFETTYYIGAGHAIRKEVFDKCGLYPDDFFYGMEELDLSFRIMEKGYKIIYYPEVVVWHKKSPLGRVTNSQKWMYTLRNRLIISYKYLPFREFFISTFIWTLKVLIRSKSFKATLDGIRLFFRDKESILRNPISQETLKKIKKLRGRIWH